MESASNVSMKAEMILPEEVLVTVLKLSAAMVITTMLLVGRSAMKLTWKSVPPLVWGMEWTRPKLCSM